MDVAALKQEVCDEVDRLAPTLLDVAHRIHDRPELAFEEHYAHELLTDVIEQEGHSPQRGAYGVPTGFAAHAGEEWPAGRRAVRVRRAAGDRPRLRPQRDRGGGPRRRPGRGHRRRPAPAARVAIIGTPAEEGGGGKIVMARHGAFDGIDAAMMIHPADADLIRMDAIAIQQLEVSFHGRAAHAAAAPHEGRNALDAAVLGYMNVAALRQHILPTERIHGIFTKGGDKPNIVPKETAMQWYVRSPTSASLQPLKQRVLHCLEGSAHACGCTMSSEWDDFPYADMRDNGPMVASYVANAARVGRDVVDPERIGRRVVGSTDMGNVSYLVPSIHPMVQVAPAGVPIHTPEFASWARRDEGDRAVLDGAKAMAMTIVDLWCDAALRASVADVFASVGPDRSVI